MLRSGFNFPTAYSIIASQTYVLQHILILIQLFLPTHLWFLLVISSHLSAPASEVTDERHPPRGPDLHQADMQAMFDNGEHNTDLDHHEDGGQEAVGQLPAHHARQPGHGVAADATRLRAVVQLILTCTETRI